ncbi:MAG: ABC transporter ATP-binding protein [Rhodospirillaceae bacterium]|nr:ABC transporter ATP-binding protein [Rhodospirillaceae bacterium]MBL6941580.1 ABC transporter ATP-binding protein [Rhodospirillales bacterium]
MSLLEIRDLSVSFGKGAGEVKAVRNISLDIERGETVALVGESGSGKSVSALSVMKLLPYPQARHPSGSIRFDGEELMMADEAHMRELRGNNIAMIFQEPLTSLNPLHSIEKQINEVLFVHKLMDHEQARARVLELLELVGLDEAMDRLDNLPHQFSGGQQQRVMIAMALANEPDLLIADEPTTAVDVTIQAQLLKLLNELRDKLGMALLLITHDLGVVRAMADRVSVMNEGRIVEQGKARDILNNPQHPYTKRLLAAEPKGAPEAADPSAPSLMSGEDVKVWFPIKQGLFRRTVDHIKAIDGVSLSVKRGHTLGIVGESGSGKSTLGRALLRLEGCEGGIVFDGEALHSRGEAELRPLRRRMQLVFQDPYGSLSPRLSIGQIVGEGLKIHDLGGNEEERHNLIAETLKEVGLEPQMMERYPHEFSGGQRQRIAIARVLVLKPDFIVMDEPTSALDMSVQAQIVDLLRDLQQRHGLTYLFISHDLKVVRAVSHDIVVMRRGKIVEQGPASEIFTNPQQPYTRALMAAALEMKADDSGVVGT